MATTPNRGLRYPASSDAPLGYAQIQNLATDVDNALAVGGAVTCTSSTHPASPTANEMIFETDTRALGFWDATASRFRMFDTVTQTYTPSLGAGVVVGTSGFNTGWYTRVGQRVFLKIVTYWSGNNINYGTASTPYTWTSPPGTTGVPASSGVMPAPSMRAHVYSPGTGTTFEVGSAIAYFQTSSTIRVKVNSTVSSYIDMQSGSPTNGSGQYVVIDGFFENQS